MKTFSLLLAALALLGAPLRAQDPFPFATTLLPEAAGAQAGANFGTRVAASAEYIVVSAPNFTDSVIGVYNATSGALVATLREPTPSSNFGRTIAVAGQRVVVAVTSAFGQNTGGAILVYELGSATPSVPFAVLFNPAPSINSFFGSSIALAGDLLVVGAAGNDAGAPDAGAVYLYDFGSATPTIPVRTFNNPTPARGDQFGTAVAIDGQRIAVTTKLPDGSTANSIYVYDLGEATPGVPIATLNQPPGDFDLFGETVAISGNRVVAGARHNDTGAFLAGAAYVFDLTSPTPSSPTLFLENPDPGDSEQFGFFVALSGDRLLVGSPGDDAGGIRPGRAYLYDLASATPRTPVAILENPTPGVFDHFGIAGALVGDRAVIGAFGDDDRGQDAGAAYLYNLSNPLPQNPVVLENPTRSADAGFGRAIASSSERIAVGARGEGVRSSGVVRVYDLGSAMPAVPVATLPRPQDTEFSGFGASLDFDGTRLLVGAPFGNDRGSAHLFQLAGGTPTLLLSLPHPSPDGEDARFGFAVAISGNRVAVSTSIIDEEMYQASTVYVYDLANATPAVPVAVVPNPFGRSNDFFGHSIALAGSRLVVGAYRAGDGGVAYVYELESGAPTVPARILRNPRRTLGDDFGFALATFGDRLAIGSPGDGTGAEDAGSVTIYDLSSATPTVPIQRLFNPSPAALDSIWQRRGAGRSALGGRHARGRWHDVLRRRGAGVRDLRKRGEFRVGGDVAQSESEHRRPLWRGGGNLRRARRRWRAAR